MDHFGSEISHDSNDIDWREFDIWLQDGGYKVKRKVEPARPEKEQGLMDLNLLNDDYDDR